MKKAHLIFLIPLMTISLGINGYAQKTPIGKKSFTIGGGGGFWSQGGDLYEDSDGNRAKTTNFNLNAGYFVVPHLSLGIDTKLDITKQGDSKFVDRGIGPFCSYYFGNTEKDEVPGSFYPYISLDYLWKLKSREFPFSNNTYKETLKIGSFGIQLGALFMIANSVGIYGNIGYDIDTGDLDWTYNTSSGSKNSQKGAVLKLGIGVKLFIYQKSFD